MGNVPGVRKEQRTQRSTRVFAYDRTAVSVLNEVGVDVRTGITR